MKEKLLTLDMLRRYKEKREDEIDAKGYITKSVNDLLNYYLTTETYSKTEVGALIAALKQFTYVSVSTLPTASADTMNKIYLVPASSTGHTADNANTKAEYITLRSGAGTQADPYTYTWEKIGDADIDLSGYCTTETLNLTLEDYVSSTALASTLAGYQTKIDASHKLSADLVEDGETNKAFTATEQGKLTGIESEAQVNIIESVEVKAGTVDGSYMVEIDDTKAKLVVSENAEVQDLFSAERFLLYESELGNYEVALVYKDNLSGMLKYLPMRSIDKRSQIDAVRYFEKPVVRFHRGKNGRAVGMHKNALAAKTWAAPNKYRLYIDTTTDGSLNFAVTINGSEKTGTVTWTAGDTLSQIASRFTGTSSYFVVTTASGENFIRVSQLSYNNTTFTISNVSGTASVEDLSKYVRINGVQQSEVHRTFMAQDVTTMFPNLGFLAANTRQYAESGINLSYRCIANETRAKYYYGTSGSGHGGVDSYLAEDAVSGRMSQAGFASLNNDGNATHQALYDKYDGDWNAYMDASRVMIDDTHSNGIESQSYDNGDTQTSALVSVTTMDFTGTYVAAFPAAEAARSVTDGDIGGFNMPTNHEIAVFMRDVNFTEINTAIALLGGTALSNSTYYWSVAQYKSYTAWFFYGNYGCLDYSYKYNADYGRALAYLN